MKQPKIEVRPIETLKNWENNPRDISPEAFERLKKQIEELDIYKPLLIHEDGTVLGGNMRLRAFREMGVKEVTVSVVNAPSEEMKIKYALSDNDQVGRTDKTKILEIIENYPNINLDKYATHFDEPETLNDFMKQFSDNKTETKPEVEFTEELFEEHNYVVLYFDNSLDWIQLQTLFPLKTVEALDSKEGFRKMGVGRVIKGSEFLSKVINNENKS